MLKAPDVPSVLLELGYLSNEKDDLALTSPAWRDKAVSRMTEAIAAFFADRGDGANLAGKDQAPAGATSAARWRTVGGERWPGHLARGSKGGGRRGRAAAVNAEVIFK